MTGEELDVQLGELEVRIERLRALYEQYFLGFEKLEPSVARKDVDRRIWTLRREHIRNTARRFKLQTLIQRYNTFQQYWHRICREIENGTYRRHLARAERIVKGSALMTIAARRRAGLYRKAVGDDSVSESGAPGSVEAASAAQAPTSEAAPAPSTRLTLDTLDLDMGFFDGSPRPPQAPAVPAAARAGRPPAPPHAPRPGHPPPPPPRRTAASPVPSTAAGASKSGDSAPRPLPAPAAAASSTGGAPVAQRAAARPRAEGAQAALSEERLRELHARLIDVKLKNNERGNVSLDKLARSLRDAEAKLREKHANRRIDFDVVVKNGKVVLKPILRR
ncbi:MAG TPA: MXAN_5187 C-terminal domain-containing protein [Polyangiaceae bacterium]